MPAREVPSARFSFRLSPEAGASQGDHTYLPVTPSTHYKIKPTQDQPCIIHARLKTHFSRGHSLPKATAFRYLNQWKPHPLINKTLVQRPRPPQLSESHTLLESPHPLSHAILESQVSQRSSLLRILTGCESWDHTHPLSHARAATLDPLHNWGSAQACVVPDCRSYLSHALVLLHRHQLVMHAMHQQHGHCQLRMVDLIALRPVLATHHGP